MTAYQGQPVVYTLSESDVIAINARRDQTGVRGNPVSAGDVCPASIVKLWNPATGYANLAVLLDGNDTYWATSKEPGTGPNCWYDPTAPAAEPEAAPAAPEGGAQ